MAGDLDIGTLSGTIALGDSFTNVLDNFSNGVVGASAAIDSVAKKTVDAGKVMGGGLEEAGNKSSWFAGLFGSSMSSVAESSQHASGEAIKTKKDFMEMFEHPVEAMKDFAHEIETEVLGSLGALGIGVAAAIGAITGLSFGIVELGQAGGKISGVEKAFDKLAEQAGTTGNELRESLSKGVHETMTQMDLMQATTRLLGSGMKLSSEQAELMGASARALGKATGEGTAGGLSIMSAALVTGRVRGLQQQIGLIDLAAGQKKFADSIGLTVDQLNAEGQLEGKRVAILDAAKSYLDKLGDSQTSWTERIKQGKIAVAEWTESLELAVNRSPNVKAAVMAIGDAIEHAFGGTGQSAIDLIMVGINKFADFIKDSVPYVVAFFSSINSLWHELLSLNTTFHVTDGIIDGMKSVWVALKDTITGIHDAVLKLKGIWGELPQTLKDIAIDATAASVAFYALNSSIVANIVTMGAGALTGAIAVIGGSLTELIGMVAAFGLEGFGVTIAGWGTALTALATGPIGWTVLAIAGLTAAIYLVTQNWDTLKDAAQATWTYIQDKVSGVWSYLVDATSTSWNTIKQVLVDISESAIGRLIFAVGELVIKVAGWAIITDGIVLWNEFKIGIGLVSDFISILYGWTTKLWGLYKENVLDNIVKVFDKLGSVVGPAVHAVFSAINTVIEKIVDGVKYLNEHTPSPTAYFSTGPDKIQGATPNILPSALVMPDYAAAERAAEVAAEHEKKVVEDVNKFKKDGLSAMETANKAAESKIEELWAEYEKFEKKSSGDTLGAKMADIDRWVAKEMASLTAAKISHKLYEQELAAISSVAFVKRIDAQKDFDDDQYKLAEDSINKSRQAGEAAAAAISKTFMGPQTILKDLLISTGAVPISLHSILTPAQELGTVMTDVTQTATKHFDELDDTIRGNFTLLVDTMHDFGVKTAEELRADAVEFKFQYDAMAESGLYTTNQLIDAWGRYQKTLEKIGPTFQQQLSMFSDDLQRIASVADNAVGKVAGALSRGIKAYQDTFKQTGGNQLASGIIGGLTIAGQFTSPGSRGANIANYATQGAMIGANPALIGATGGLSVPIGAGVGALVGAFKVPDDEKAARQQLTDFKNAIASAFDDTASASAKAATGTDAWSKMVQQVAQAYITMGGTTKDALTAINDAADHTRNGVEGETDSLKKMNDTIKMSMDFSNQAQKSADAVGLIDIKFVALLYHARDLGTVTDSMKEFVAAQTTMAEGGIDRALGVTNDAMKKRVDLQNQLNGLLDKQEEAGPIVKINNLIDKQEKLNMATSEGRYKWQDYQDQIDKIVGKGGDLYKNLIDTKAALEVQNQIIDATAVKTQASADAVSGSLLAIIDSQITAGKSYHDSIVAIAPDVQALTDQMVMNGVAGSAAFDTLRGQVDLMTDAVAGPALDALEGYTTGLTGLNNSGLLTQDVFAGITGQITQTFDALVAQGKDGQQVLSAMRGPLQTVWELEQKFGFATDDATQALVDQAVQQGIVGETAKPINEQMLDATNKIAAAVTALAEAFGVKVPQAIDTMANSTRDATGRVTKDTQAAADALAAQMAAATAAGLTDPTSKSSVAGGAIDAAATLQKQIQAAAASANLYMQGIKGPSIADIDFKIKGHYEYDGQAPDVSNAAAGGLVTQNGVLHLSQGGTIWSPSGSDTIPAELTPGETVVSASDTNAQAVHMRQLVDNQDATNAELAEIRMLLARQPRDMAVALEDAVLLLPRR